MSQKGHLKGHPCYHSFPKGNTPWNGRDLAADPREQLRREKIRVFRLGKHHSPDTRVKISEALTGKPNLKNRRPRSQEVKDKISSKLKGREVPWIVGIPRSEATKAKLRAVRLGQKSKPETKEKIRLSKLGQKPSEVTRQKMVQGNAHYWKGKKKPFMSERQASPEYKDKVSRHFRELWANPEYKERVVRKVLAALFRHPNKLEQKVIEVIAEYALPYKFVGDGSVILNGLNPDFINTNGDKEVVEVFGDMFHNPKRTFRRTLPTSTTEEGRKERFAEVGFSMLVLWESELKGMSNEQIAHKILAFENEV